MQGVARPRSLLRVPQAASPAGAQGRRSFCHDLPAAAAAAAAVVAAAVMAAAAGAAVAAAAAAHTHKKVSRRTRSMPGLGQIVHLFGCQTDATTRCSIVMHTPRHVRTRSMPICSALEQHTVAQQTAHIHQATHRDTTLSALSPTAADQMQVRPAATRACPSLGHSSASLAALRPSSALTSCWCCCCCSSWPAAARHTVAASLTTSCRCRCCGCRWA